MGKFPLDFRFDASKEFMQTLWSALEENGFDASVSVYDHQRRIVISAGGKEIAAFIINRDASILAPNGARVGPASFERQPCTLADSEPNLEADMAAGRAFTLTAEPDNDLQASLGQKAHE